MHDRIPWLKGNTKYGLTVDLGDLPSGDFNQRSGTNFNGDSKCLANRHDM